MGFMTSRLESIKARDEVPKYTKNKTIQVPLYTGFKEKVVKDYEYCFCDYCLKEIMLNRYTNNKKTKPKWEEQTGGIIKLGTDKTGLTTDIEVALHNQCLNPTLAEFEEMKNK